MIPGDVYRSHGIYLTAEKNPENLSFQIVDEGCAISHRLKWVPLPPNDVGRMTQLVRKGDERNKEKDGVPRSDCIQGTIFFFYNNRWTYTDHCI